ncbi:MAG: hypothetical protein AAF547_14840 [Actinomycetota bacterium]
MVPLAVLALLLAGCGGAFQTPLSVETDRIAADPLLVTDPAGSAVEADTTVTGTSTSFRLRKVWRSVTDAAFHGTLRAAAGAGTAFGSADCFDGGDGQRVTIISGSKHSDGYPVAVQYRWQGDELSVELGGSNDLARVDAPAADPVQPDALSSDTCTEAELERLEQQLR